MYGKYYNNSTGAKTQHEIVKSKLDFYIPLISLGILQKLNPNGVLHIHNAGAYNSYSHRLSDCISKKTILLSSDLGETSSKSLPGVDVEYVEHSIRLIHSFKPGMGPIHSAYSINIVLPSVVDVTEDLVRTQVGLQKAYGVISDLLKSTEGYSTQNCSAEVYE
jgi:hypothetical protein